MIRSHRLVATTITASLAFFVAGAPGFAQQQKQAAPPPAAQQAAPQPPELKQVAITDKQIQEFLDSQSDLESITSKLSDDPSKPPDAKTMAALDGIVKKHGFASYADYGNVAANIDMLLDGFDPQSKKFIGFEAVLKSQISQVQADTKMPAKDKKAALEELNASLKDIPKIEFPANIEVVAKYYDKLNDALRAQE
jgi:hypothetical protein